MRRVASLETDPGLGEGSAFGAGDAPRGHWTDLRSLPHRKVRKPVVSADPPGAQGWSGYEGATPRPHHLQAGTSAAPCERAITAAAANKGRSVPEGEGREPPSDSFPPLFPPAPFCGNGFPQEGAGQGQGAGARTRIRSFSAVLRSGSTRSILSGGAGLGDSQVSLR